MRKHARTLFVYTSIEVCDSRTTKTTCNLVVLIRLLQVANYDFKTIHSILASTFFSDVSFVVTGEDGEPSPFCLPMTAVAGQYDPSRPLPEDDGDEAEYTERQEDCDDRPFDVYLHGNTAMLLSKIVKGKASVKVAISSTKSMGETPGGSWRCC